MKIQKGDNWKEVAYWRKANQIHAWFVREVQNDEDDCGRYEVSLAKLKELSEICQKVLDNPDLAEKLLPSSSGFFFGSTAYDEYYFADVKDTIEQIDAILNNRFYKDCVLEYQASW